MAPFHDARIAFDQMDTLPVKYSSTAAAPLGFAVVASVGPFLGAFVTY